MHDAPRRRLLLVSHRPLEYEGPGTVRWRYFIEHLPEHGWDVTTATGRTGVTSDELSADPRVARLSSLRARVMAGVGRVTRPVANQLLGVQPEALAPSIAWSLTGRRMLRERIAAERPDVVVATSPPVAALFAAGSVLRNSGIPAVADLRDPWAGHPTYDAGGPLLPRLEERALRPFAAIVGVTPGMTERLARLHPAVAGRLHLLPNGFAPELLDRRAPARVRAPGERLTLIHPGVLYGDRSVDDLLAAIAVSGLAAQLRLVLVGNLNAASEQALRAAPAGLEVEVVGPRPWADAMDLVAAADVVVVIVPESMGDDVAWPVKLFEAVALGKPVLAITSGGATEVLLGELGRPDACGRVGDVASVIAALRHVIDAPGAPVSAERLARWNRATVTADYATLLDDLVRSDTREATA